MNITVKLIINMALVLAITFASTAAHAQGGGCAELEQSIWQARQEGDFARVVNEMTLAFSAAGLKTLALTPDEAVSCAVAGTGDVVLVIDKALASGISEEDVKKGIARYLEFDPLKNVEPDKFEGVRRTRFELNFFGGLGSSARVFYSNIDSRSLEMASGGGLGGGMTLGYVLTPEWEMDFSVGYHVSSGESGSVDSEGAFERYSALLMLKYRYGMSDDSWLKLGLGGGYFIPVRYTVEMPPESLSMDYGSAPAAVASMEYEMAVGPKESHAAFVMGLRYYYVRYDLDAAVFNNADLSVASLPADLRELDGGGAEFIVGIINYF